MQVQIEDIEKQAKLCLEETGEHKPQLMIENGKVVEIMLLIFETNEEKDVMYKAMRKHIDTIQCSRYFVIMEGWAGNSSNIPPSKQPNKKEVLIISEFQRNMKNKIIINYFTRDGKKINWGERHFSDKNDEMVSRFNFFVEDTEETQKEIIKNARWQMFIKEHPTAIQDLEKFLDEHKDCNFTKYDYEWASC
jgi:hypothetical protein